MVAVLSTVFLRLPDVLTIYSIEAFNLLAQYTFLMSPRMAHQLYTLE